LQQKVDHMAERKRFVISAKIGSCSRVKRYERIDLNGQCESAVRVPGSQECAVSVRRENRGDRRERIGVNSR
jgi:hypothetical protein